MQKSKLRLGSLFVALILIASATTFAIPVGGRGSSQRLSVSEQVFVDNVNAADALEHVEYLKSLGQKSVGSLQEWMAAQHIYANLNQHVDFVEIDEFNTMTWENVTATLLKVGGKGFSACTYG